MKSENIFGIHAVRMLFQTLKHAKELTRLPSLENLRHLVYFHRIKGEFLNISNNLTEVILIN